MITTNPIINKRYWCILHSNESDGYGDYAPVKPWQGVFSPFNNSMNGVGGSLYRVSTLFKCGYDVDSNATATVMPKDLYISQEEAQEAFDRAALEYVLHELDKLREFTKDNTKVLWEEIVKCDMLRHS